MHHNHQVLTTELVHYLLTRSNPMQHVHNGSITSTATLQAAHTPLSLITRSLPDALAVPAALSAYIAALALAGFLLT